MTMTDSPARPAIYVRISKDQTLLGRGVERQLEDCQALVRARGWGEPAIYSDNDISAYSGRKRPEYERMLGDLEAGTVDAVVMWHPDRLHRSTKELERFIDIIEATKARVESVQSGAYDLTTPTGRMQAKIVGAVAQFESEHKSERQRRQHLQRASDGKPQRTGVRPFGYTRDWSALVDEEADLIREAAARVLAGESLRGVCADWGKRGIVTSTGGRWQQWPLRRMLTSARIAGVSEYAGYDGKRRRKHGEKVATGNWPAIIDEATLERLRAVLNDPRRRTSFVNARSYLLSGYIFCAECQKPLRARPRSDKARRYVCATGPMFQGCGSVAILADPTERLVEGMLLHRLSGPALMAALAEPVTTTDDGAEAAALAADRDALRELNSDYYDRQTMDRPTFLGLRDRLQERIAQREARLTTDTASAVLRPLRDDGRDLRVVWDELALDQRRAIIGAAINRVVVGRAVKGRNRFDPDRVDVEWRG